MDQEFLNGIEALAKEFDERIKKLESYVFQVADDRIQTLEHTVNDVVIASLKEANDEYEYHMALEAFKELHPEVGGLQEPLSALYGDDYDVYEDLYRSMGEHANDEGFDEDEYVRSQIESVKGKLDALRGQKPAEEEVVKEEVIEEEPEEGKWDEEELAKELAAAKA